MRKQPKTVAEEYKALRKAERNLNIALIVLPSIAMIGVIILAVMAITSAK